MKLKRILTTFGLLSMIGAVGCKSAARLSNGQFFRVTQAIDDPRTAVGKPVDLDAICFPEDMSGAVCNTTAYRRAASDEYSRNRLQAYLMTASDTECAVHASSLLNASTNMNLLTGLASLGLGAAAPLIKPVLTKNAFAAGAALASGSKSLLNDEIYKQMLITSILKAMQDSRDAQAATIRGRQRELVAVYSVDQAILDVVEYHDRCSFYRAMTELSQAVGKKATCSAIGARREDLLRKVLAAAGNSVALASYQKEMDIIDQQIAECR